MEKSIESGDLFYIENDRLKAEILTPWSTKYNRTRFCHSGFISGVWLNGRKYTEKEVLTPPRKPTGGIGLCSEYKCESIENDSKIGDPWLKIGVGILTRSKEPWNILDEHRIIGLPTQVHYSNDTAAFDCQSPLVNGYSYREKREIQLAENTILQTIRLWNTGTKDVLLTEYCHNFVSLAGATIDENHRMFLPCLVNPETQVTANGLLGTREGASWVETPKGSVSQICHEIRRPDSYSWKLASTVSNASVSETVSFTPSYVVLWSRDYCSCVEICYQFTLHPGESLEWSRKWIFE